MPDEPIAQVGRGEGLARAGRHLDQGPRAILPQRRLKVTDRGRLDLPQPGVVQLGHGTQPSPEGRRLGIGDDLSGPLDEGLGAMEREDPAATGIRVIAVREPGLGAG